VPVDAARFGRGLEAGRQVTVGVRPHDFMVATEGAPDVAGTLRVELVEALGFEAFAHGWLREGGPRVVVRLDADRVKEAKAAKEIALRVDAAHVHLFDAGTGAALSGG
jgi:ABC-type sugar transport system ATPase subunit